MRSSHLCSSCGYDLAWHRAVREPIYGLAVVRCPECGRVSVRERHPTVRRWRQTIWVLTAVRALIAQALMAAALLLWSSFACVWLAMTVEDDGWWAVVDPSASIRGYDFGGLNAGTISFVGISMVAGLWLTVGLAHWRRWAAWGTWGGLLAVVLSLDVVTVPGIWNLIRPLVEHSGSLPVNGEAYLLRFVAVGLMMTIAVAGVPLARMALRANRAYRKRRWGRRKRRWRARSAARSAVQMASRKVAPA